MPLARVRRSTTCLLMRNRDVVKDSQCSYCTRAIGRKRVACNGPGALASADATTSPCNELSIKGRSRRKLRPLEMPPYLESLPQDVLIRIMYLVNHSDVESLLGVSKTIREAALIAKKSYFAFSTPLSKPVFKEAESFDYASKGEVPGAPRQRTRATMSRVDGKQIGSIVVQLFTHEEDCLDC